MRFTGLLNVPMRHHYRECRSYSKVHFPRYKLFYSLSFYCKKKTTYITVITFISNVQFMNRAKTTFIMLRHKANNKFAVHFSRQGKYSSNRKFTRNPVYTGILNPTPGNYSSFKN